ncbi:MAG: hypothetical protein LBU91_02030 [Bacteroidales bacterium]|jgi:hypothetical protein|nr:hypothetical protein [Bacteroidales bacterium]
MKTLTFKLAMASAVLLMLAGVLNSCKEDDSQQSSSLCSNINSVDINQSLPMINHYLSGLPEILDDTRKLQALIGWLKADACIVDAEILCNSCIYTNPPMSEILLSFKENGILKHFVFDIAMTKPLVASNYHLHYTANDVFVKTKKDFTIHNVFNFINSLDHEVEKIEDGIYVSSMPSDSLQYILDKLNAKPYTNDGNAWKATGYLHYSTNQVTIFTHLFDMKNASYQEDWVKTINDYQLSENMNYNYGGYIIHFKVNEGKEKLWEGKFKEYDFVEWAELNYFGHIILHNSAHLNFEQIARPQFEYQKQVPPVQSKSDKY